MAWSVLKCGSLTQSMRRARCAVQCWSISLGCWQSARLLLAHRTPLSSPILSVLPQLLTTPSATHRYFIIIYSWFSAKSQILIYQTFNGCKHRFKSSMAACGWKDVFARNCCLSGFSGKHLPSRRKSFCSCLAGIFLYLSITWSSPGVPPPDPLLAYWADLDS